MVRNLVARPLPLPLLAAKTVLTHTRLSWLVALPEVVLLSPGLLKRTLKERKESGRRKTFSPLFNNNNNQLLHNNRFALVWLPFLNVAPKFPKFNKLFNVQLMICAKLYLSLSCPNPNIVG